MMASDVIYADPRRDEPDHYVLWSHRKSAAERRRKEDHVAAAAVTKQEKKILGVKVYRRVDDWRKKAQQDPAEFGVKKSTRKDIYMKTLEYTADERIGAER